MPLIESKIMEKQTNDKIPNSDLYISCPVCASRCKKWRKISATTGVYSIVRCISCGYAFVHNRPTYEYLKEYYSTEGHNAGVPCRNEKAILATVLNNELDFPNSTVDAKRIVKTVSSIRGDKRDSKTFLDIGCGYGFFTREAIDNDYKVTALEFAATERSITREMTGINAIEESFEEFSGKDGKYDVILMSQILEHAVDINEWIGKAYKLLNKNGILVIALPNFMNIFRIVLNEKDPYICPPAHLNYFSLKSLKLFMQKYELTVIKVQFASRISKKALLKKCFNKIILMKLCYPLVCLLLKLTDLFYMGMMLNIYALKKD